MNADQDRSDELDRITEKIIGCAFEVANALGSGFLEKVYENALAHELRKSGLLVEPQHPIVVRYDGVVVGDYIADLIVNRSVIVELKACKALDETAMAQCMNYLRATGFTVCILLNFGTPRVQVKRIVHNF